MLELLFTKVPRLAVCKVLGDNIDDRPSEWENNIVILPQCFLKELSVKNLTNHENAWVLNRKDNELIIVRKGNNADSMTGPGKVIREGIL